MIRFSISRAALILTVFLSLSLGWISFRYYQQQSELVHFFEKEAVGISAAKELTIELLAFSTSPSISQDQARKALALVRQEHILKLVPNNNIKTTADALVRSLDSKTPNRPLTNEEVHHIAQLVKDTLQSVTEETNLILDPSLPTYYFADALFAEFPEVIYHHHSWQELLDLRKTKNHEALFAEIGARQAAFERYQQGLRKGHAGELPPSLANLSAQTMLLFAALIEPGKTDNGLFNGRLTQWRRDSENVLNQQAQAFTNLNDKRIRKTVDTLRVSLAVFFASWLISLAYFIFIVRSFLASRNVLHRVIRAQRDALAKATKLVTLGEMSANIGHEITNPLSVIRASAELLEKTYGEAQPGIYDHTERIRRMALRIEEIIHSMKTFLNKENEEAVHPAPVNIIKILEDVREEFQPRLDALHADLSLENPYGKSILVMGNYGELLQVFTNLVSNALDAIKNEPLKKISIRVHLTDAFTEIEVQDSGPGVPKELRRHIFEALFTTKIPGEGTGLGLSIAQKIVSRYQGRLRLSDKGPGACFEVLLNRYFL